MMQQAAAAILALSLSPALHANDNAEPKEYGEYEYIWTGSNDGTTEKTVRVDYPGLVRWFENGHQMEDYQIPGCFYVMADRFKDDDSAYLAKVREFSKALEVKGRAHSMTLKEVNGGLVFVDLDVASVYVDWYAVRPKDGSTFGQLFKKIFGDAQDGLQMRYDRGCKDLRAPLFVKPSLHM